MGLPIKYNACIMKNYSHIIMKSKSYTLTYDELSSYLMLNIHKGKKKEL